MRYFKGFLGLAVLAGMALAQAQPALAEGLTAKAVVAANAAATDYQEWKSSGQTPEDFFAQFKPTQEFELCTELSQLKDEDLALFENEIDEHFADRGNTKSCGDSLKARLSQHWQNVAKSMGLAPKDVMGNHVLALNFADGAPLQEKKIETVEQIVKTSDTPIFSSGNLGEKEICITFDDGPHPDRTPRLLEILKAYGARVNFFEVGKNAKAFPSVSKSLVDAGHIVGSHSWSHPNMKAISFDHASAEIKAGREAVAAATGLDTPFFRFPYGNRTGALQKFVKDQGLSTFFWNMDSLDWKLRDPKVLWANVTKELNTYKQGIILFHDVHEQTILTIPRLLDELIARGYRLVVFVPVK